MADTLEPYGSRGTVAERTGLAAIMRQLPIGLLIIDDEGELQFANRRAEELLGLSAAEMAISLREALWTLRDRLGFPASEYRRAPARTLAAGEARYNQRVELELPNGRFTFEGSAFPVQLEDGVLAAVVTFQDVTAQEQRERAERDFVTNAAHELQTPIAAITSAIEVLQAGAKHNEADRDRFLSHIEAACARLDRLTRALLVLARAQSGDEDPRAELVEVEPLLRAVANALPLEADVDVVCEHDVAVIANRSLLEQALVSLGANAFKFTRGRVLLTAERDGGRVRLEVRDEGGGIEPTARARVFDRFYRGEDEREGFGLGLAIVAEAVRAMNGELTLDSTSGGTGVSISLPAASIVHK
jgi:two-component system phosphate regulon sensor histidine kinase PhoR